MAMDSTAWSRTRARPSTQRLPTDFETGEETMRGVENGVFGSGLAPRRFDNSFGRRASPPDPKWGESSPAYSVERADGELSSSSSGSFKHVALSAIDCALAHWY